MTLPSSGQIYVSQINQEIGRATGFSSNLNFLNGLILPSIRPGTPNMAGFYGLSYFQKNTAGNCNGTGINNCCENCATGNCPIVDPSNCNCGCGDQSQNCHVCANCGAINCANCDSQSWLQTGNCEQQPPPSYNCQSFQCYAQACNCSKIICTKLHSFGMMPYQIFAADQKYGDWLRKNDKVVYRGYIRWAKTVTSWMDGNGPDFMLWVNKKERKETQKESTIKWAYKIATPWSEHMAYLMGSVKNDNEIGKILMKIGRPICKMVFMLPKEYKLGLFGSYIMWSLCLGSFFYATTVVKTKLFFKKINPLKLFWKEKIQ
jgi:hypothetical protein